MKNVFVVLIMFSIVAAGFGQKYFTKTGFTDFKASVEAFEPVEAENNSTTAVLNTENGEVAVLMFIKAFRFEVALMEEHFNENYMDSDKYPKAVFKGKLKDFDFEELGEEEKEYKCSGELTIRGKSKAIDTVVKLKREGSAVRATSEFVTAPGDFGIDIPSIVKNKISKTVKISLNYELVKR